jgi:hypothetical protein
MAPIGQYGKVAVLTITETKPIIEQNELRGKKTVYVRARKNWPQLAAPTHPTVPADIEIVVRNKVGASIVEDTFALPAVGAAFEVQGDGLEVFAYYSPKQALAVPYASYEIEAGITPGGLANTPSSRFFYTQDDYAFDIVYPAVPNTYYPIPSYSSEMRITSDSLGKVYLYQPGALYTIENFDFGQAREWTRFCVDKYQYSLALIAPGPYNYIATHVEFR